MDTRPKIISASEAVTLARDPQIRILAGYFDPLLAEHARSIAEVAQGDPLLVLVLDDAAALLPAGARAELVAALRSVRYVSVVSRAELNEQFEGINIVSDEDTDIVRQRKLLQHIRDREPR